REAPTALVVSVTGVLEMESGALEGGEFCVGVVGGTSRVAHVEHRGRRGRGAGQTEGQAPKGNVDSFARPRWHEVARVVARPIGVHTCFACVTELALGA